MAVQLADRSLGIIHRGNAAPDAHGDTAPGAEQLLAGPWPGRAKEKPDQSWAIALDPAAAPVNERDIVVDTVSGQQWVIMSHTLLRNTVDPIVDYVRIETALLRVGTDVVPVPVVGDQVGPS